MKTSEVIETGKRFSRPSSYRGEKVPAERYGSERHRRADVRRQAGREGSPANRNSSLGRFARCALCAGPLGVAADLPGHGCGRQGWRHQARHVGNKSARLPGDFLQVAELRRSRSRLSLAMCQGATGAWTHRYFQSQLLRRDLGRACASRVSHRTEAAERMRQQRDLEAPLRGHPQF